MSDLDHPHKGVLCAALDVEARQATFSVLIGTSQQNVSKLVSKGILKPGESYRSWLISYVENLREKASGRDSEKSLTEARIAEAEASGDLKRLQVLEKLGSLVEMESVEHQLKNWASMIRGAVLAAGEKIKESVESKYDIALDDEIIEKPLHAALRDVSRYPGSADEDAAAGGGGALAAGADIDG